MYFTNQAHFRHLDSEASHLAQGLRPTSRAFTRRPSVTPITSGVVPKALSHRPRQVSNIRASGSYIRGTNGQSNGLVPMLKNFNETARYVDQAGDQGM